MIGPEERILLDTNIVVELVRWKGAGQAIDAAHRLTARQDSPLICGVTLGETQSLARHWGWGIEKTSKLRALLRRLVVIDIELDIVVQRYAEIDQQSRAVGRNMGKNDVWIAAAAVAADAVLLTGDHDFDHLVDAGVLRRELHVPTHGM